MTPELDAVAAADEEARARADMAEARHEREVAGARAVRDAAIEGRRKAAQEALEGELRAIRDDGERRLAEVKAQQDAYLAALAAVGETKFQEAVAAYARIVGGVS